MGSEPPKRSGLRLFLGTVDAYQRSHPWLGLPYAVIKKFGDDEAGDRAALIAYYAFFSLFPLMLALVTVLGFVLAGHPGLQNRVVHSTLAQFPVIGQQLQQNVHSLRGRGLALVVGLAGLLWAGLGAVQAGQNAMNTVWNVPLKDRPNFISSKGRGLTMLGVLGLGALITTALSGIGTAGGTIGLAVRILGVMLSLLADIGLFLLAFRILPNLELRWGQLLPGAVVGGLAWTALQAVGSYYVQHQLKGASQTYGTFAIVIGLLSWLYLQAQITLLAAEINVVRDRNLWPRSLTGDDLTAADLQALRRYAKVEERLDAELVDVKLEPSAADRQP